MNKKLHHVRGRVWTALLNAALSLPLFAALACAQQPPQQQSAGAALSGAASNAAAPKTGGASTSALKSYHIKPSDLPPPNHSESAQNPPKQIDRPAGAELTLPPGFKIEVFAEGDFKRLRWIAVAPNGDVFVTDADANNVILLRDTNGDGKADQRFTFAENLNKPFGMEFWRGYFYVANTNGVVRFPYKDGQTKAEGAPEPVTDLPGRGYREHWTRNIIASPDGSKMYVSVGSATNVDVEPEPRASILEMNPDGSAKRLFATGVRNPIGMAFAPGGKTLFAAVQERDQLGDDLVPDYVTSIKDGGFYGWPYAYMGPKEDPRRKGERADLVQKTIAPEVLIQAHSAVLGLTFYGGRMFPKDYQGDAFVALHGSWNRAKRTGYKVVRLRFANGKPVGGYEDFVTGWMLGEDQKEVWGRPVGLATMKDGSLLITDDVNDHNKIWRVTYTGKK